MTAPRTSIRPERNVKIEVDAGTIEGTLVVPEPPHGVVLFAHGSGSSRRSPRNWLVAERLQQAGLATMLFDLLTPTEERTDDMTGRLRFDIDFLARRLLMATDWLVANPETQGLSVGYFGASTGAAAALVAAAERPAIQAVVSRGGRPDLADRVLDRVQAAALLIVGSHDVGVVELNRQAYHRLVRARDKEMTLVPGATHLFEEPGALDEVARLAADWFVRHLAGAATVAVR